MSGSLRKVNSVHVVQEKGGWNKRDHHKSEKELDVRRTTAARERMGILELLCKRGVDFLREALTVLVEGIMEVSCKRTCFSLM